MLPVVFRLDFFGGPQDGLCVYSRAVPDTRLLFPVGREMDLHAVTAYCRIDDATAAIYQFDYTMILGKFSNFLPVLHYRFTGFSSTAPRKCGAFRWVGQHWPLSRLAVKFRRLNRRFRDWWLEPVSYPLQVSFPADVACDRHGVTPS